MSRRTVVLSLALLSASAFTAPPPAHAQSLLKDRSVVSGEYVYVLLPPELACAQTVVEAKWSADGRYVLTLCRTEHVAPPLAQARALAQVPGEAPGTQSLLVWSAETHTPKEVWSRPIGKASIEEWQWLPASDKAYAVINEPPLLPNGKPRRAVWWIQAAAANARAVTEIPFDRLTVPEGQPHISTAVEPSPVEPLALVLQQADRFRHVKRPDGTSELAVDTDEVITPIRRDGTLAAAVHLQDASFAGWADAGGVFYLRRIDRPEGPKARPTRTFFAYDLRTGKLDQLAQAPPEEHVLLRCSYAPGQAPDPEPPAMLPEAYPLHLAPSTAEVKSSDTSASLRPLWLVADRVSQKPRALVCPDASWSQISPGRDAVLYVSQGAAWVRPILRLSQAAYAAMELVEERRRVVADASVLAKAIQNMADSGEYYPRPDQLRDWLLPYLKGDEGLLGKLVFTHEAGVGLFTPDVAAKTVVGHVLGPGGRAIIYADGRAVWKDD